MLVVYCNKVNIQITQRDDFIQIEVDVTFFLAVFWTTAWVFFNEIKSDLTDTFLKLSV